MGDPHINKSIQFEFPKAGIYQIVLNSEGKQISYDCQDITTKFKNMENVFGRNSFDSKGWMVYMCTEILGNEENE